MKYIFSLCLIVFSLTIAHAGLIVKIGFISQNSTNPLMGVVDRIKDNRCREDMFFSGGKIGVEILNLDTCEVFNLMPNKNMLAKAHLNQSVLTNAIVTDVIKDTGKREVVNGYDAKIYTYTNSVAGYTLWVAKYFPNFETIKADLVKRDRLGEVTQNGLFHLSTLPGMLLQYRIDNMPTNAPPLQVIVSEEPINDSIFDLPKDYHIYNTNAPAANTNEVISAANTPVAK
jgi:hypothetical protein